MVKLVLTLQDGGECMVQTVVDGKMGGVAYGHSGLEGQGVYIDKVQMSDEVAVKIGQLLNDFGVAILEHDSQDAAVTATSSGPTPDGWW